MSEYIVRNQILRDTLIAFDVPAWKKTRKRKPISTAKFYFFDGGVVRQLQHRSFIQEESPEFGEAFETYIAHELKAYVDYQGTGELCYWRSKSGYEVDFILSDTTAIGVQAKSNVHPSDLKGLRALREEKQLRHYLMVGLESRPRIVDGMQVLPWQEFLDRLWQSEFSA
jgi:predicted AAA+ superfamily ATPase